MKPIIVAVLALALVGAGIWYAFGGGEAKPVAQLGSGVQGSPTPIGDIVKSPDGFVGRTVTVEGRLTKECPSSGCWWYVKDESGEIRADSLGAGFALPLRQEGKRIRTAGKITKLESGELQIAATGAEVR